MQFFCFFLLLLLYGEIKPCIVHHAPMYSTVYIIIYSILYAQYVNIEHFRMCIVCMRICGVQFLWQTGAKSVPWQNFVEQTGSHTAIPEWAKARHVQFDPSNLPSFFSFYITYIHTLSISIVGIDVRLFFVCVCVFGLHNRTKMKL